MGTRGQRKVGPALTRAQMREALRLKERPLLTRAQSDEVRRLKERSRKTPKYAEENYAKIRRIEGRALARLKRKLQCGVPIPQQNAVYGAIGAERRAFQVSRGWQPPQAVQEAARATRN